MPTTLSISGGYSKFLERLEDRFEDAPPSFKEKLGVFGEKIENSIDFLQDRVDQNDDLIIGDKLGEEIFTKLNKFFPNGEESIALGIDFLKSEPAPSDFPEVTDVIDSVSPIVFGSTEETGGGGSDLLGLLDQLPGNDNLGPLDDFFPGGRN